VAARPHGGAVSIMKPFERLFDTPAQIEMQAREERADAEGEPEGEGDPPMYRCRVCGLEAPIRHYCPTCLADTMKPIAARQP
jgi:rubrerythrin